MTKIRITKPLQSLFSVLLICFTQLAIVQTSLAQSNIGSDSVDQLPSLEGILTEQLRQDERANAEKTLARIIAVEEKNPARDDESSIKMQLELGHYYLVKLAETDPNQESSVDYLRKAHDYFMAVIERNKDMPFNQGYLPYGELAMAAYLSSNINRKPEFIHVEEDSDAGSDPTAEGRGIVSDTSQRVTLPAPAEDIAYNDYLNRTIPNVIEELKEYYNKAIAEKNAEEALSATMAIGDLNFLVGRDETADKYYQFAWKLAGVFPEQHPQKMALTKPSKIPSFNYTYSSVMDSGSAVTVDVPLQFDIDERGRLRDISSTSDDISSQLSSKARREVRDLIFRPALDGGNRVKTDEFAYIMAVEQ